MNNKIFTTVCELLENGANERDHDFHIMTFCTIGKVGVEARSVVLRSFDKDKNIIRFHTDYRSPKLNDIKNNPNTVCLVYSYKLKTQLRIKTISSIHYEDAIWKASWESTGLSSRKCYLTKYDPSCKIDKKDDGLPFELKGKTPSLKQSEDGKKNFCVVDNKITEIDYLYLKSSGHERMRLDFSSYRFSWMAP
ncbi:pyridoxamine 5'-phosphate oxidase family protein [Paracoccaceae bacterium]|nr:pyridoxamine 5'-phosphate oxidase family protein [Paracoccaceae bacterium]